MYRNEIVHKVRVTFTFIDNEVYSMDYWALEENEIDDYKALIITCSQFNKRVFVNNKMYNMKNFASIGCEKIGEGLVLNDIGTDYCSNEMYGNMIKEL